METVYCQKLGELKREKRFLERKLHVTLTIEGRKVTIEGDALDEYEATLVLDAINMGFSAAIASLIVEEDMVYEKINIKDFTRRRNLDLVRGRLIGTHGKTKNTIEQISGCTVKIKGNDVGLIGSAEEMPYAITAVTNVIKGSKQTNVYKYLERINTQKKRGKKAVSK